MTSVFIRISEFPALADAISINAEILSSSTTQRHPTKKSDALRKLNPNPVPWEELAGDVQEFDRNIIRRIRYVFAKANHKVIEVLLPCVKASNSMR